MPESLMQNETSSQPGKPVVHYWERFAPHAGITIAKCGRAVPYDDDTIIVLWAEKDATCPDCISMGSRI